MQGIVFSMLAGAAAGQTNATFRQADDLADVVGSTHVRGFYHHTDTDYLNEGADALLGMGSRVVKVWFYNGGETPAVMYPYNSDWPEVADRVEGAKTPYWKAFFDKPFTTYVLNTLATGMPGYYFVDGITDAQAAEEQRQMYELAKHFLTEYKNTGKTFIFAMHEMDWHLKAEPNPELETPEERFDRTIKWLRARQAGVDQARDECGMEGVQVFHAAEIVNVRKSLRDGQDNMVNRVLPHVDLDLISYSAYDATVLGKIFEREELKDCLDYIAANARPSRYFGNKQVFLGEYGCPENDYGLENMRKVVQNATEVALDWGCPYVIYWQLYCNEPKAEVRVPGETFGPSNNNDDFRGFWLIRADGTQNWCYEYFSRLCREGRE
jgi:hypothetical protein